MGSAWPPDRLRIEAAVRCCGSNIARKNLRLHCSSAQLSIPWESRWQLACIDIRSQDFGIDLTRFHFLSRVFPLSEIIDSKGNARLGSNVWGGLFYRLIVLRLVRSRRLRLLLQCGSRVARNNLRAAPFSCSFGRGECIDIKSRSS